jgi:hypothetical protein
VFVSPHGPSVAKWLRRAKQDSELGLLSDEAMREAVSLMLGNADSTLDIGGCLMQGIGRLEFWREWTCCEWKCYFFFLLFLKHVHPLPCVLSCILKILLIVTAIMIAAGKLVARISEIAATGRSFKHRPCYTVRVRLDLVHYFGSRVVSIGEFVHYGTSCGRM